mgnify:FL=1
MFLQKYVSEFYYNQILDNYKTEYLKLLDEQNFLKIYKLFVEYKFYFIEDIILKYLEIFEMEYSEVKQKLELLRVELGKNFVFIIGNNMNYLNCLIDY